MKSYCNLFTLAIAMMLSLYTYGQDDLNDIFDDGGASMNTLLVKVAPSQWLVGEFGGYAEYRFSNLASFEGGLTVSGKSKHIWNGYLFPFPINTGDREVESLITEQVERGVTLAGEFRYYQVSESTTGVYYALGGRYRSFSLLNDQSIKVIEPYIGGGYQFSFLGRGFVNLGFGGAYQIFQEDLSDPLLEAEQLETSLLVDVNLKVGFSIF